MPILNPETAHAASESVPTISISKASAKPSEIVEVTVDISGNTGITSIDFSINYDTSQLELIDKKNGSLLGGLMNSQSMDKVPYYCGWINSLQKNNCTDDGTLITLVFKVKAGAENGKHEICFDNTSVTAYDADLQELNFEATDGCIEVEGGKDEIKPDAVKPPTSSDESQAENDENQSAESGDKESGEVQTLTAKQKKIIEKTEAMKIKWTSAKYSKSKKAVVLKYYKSNKSYKLDGYMIYSSAKRSKGFKKIVTTSKTSRTDKLSVKQNKQSKQIYYKIRGFRKVAGKTYYTQWSSKKKVRITR